MAKIPQTRFPDPPQEYDPRAFADLVRQLDNYLQLNSSYQQDNANEQTRRAFFFG